MRNFEHKLDEFVEWHKGTTLGKQLKWPFQKRAGAGNPKDVVVRYPEKYKFVPTHDSVKVGIKY